jgi:hypothetical protein
MCVDRVLASPRITQADPDRRTPPHGGSVTVPAHHSKCTVGLQMPTSPSFLLGRHALLWLSAYGEPSSPCHLEMGSTPHRIPSRPDAPPSRTTTHRNSYRRRHPRKGDLAPLLHRWVASIARGLGQA